ncbi:MAG: penicillin-binding protein 1A [Gammaproteobacteria bacterium]|nr:MAG: penicillin-binding protein 1A [Gammaproteobacteria bacterium]
MLRFTAKLFALLCLAGILSIIGLCLYIIPKLPEIETLREVKMQVPLRVYSQDGSLIAEFGEKRRQPIRIEEIPRSMIEAVLAAEDDRFYEHPGVDWQGITRAVVNLILTGKKSIGGSTITMQVARNFFLSFEKSYIRKINEIFLALKIERELSKDEILELYMNKVFFGHRAYGVGAAALVYYGQELNNLTLPQIAMIAGSAQSPSRTNPVSNPDRALIRRKYVLGRMLEQGYITEEEYDGAVNAPETASLHGPIVDLEAPDVAEMVRSQMVSRFGEAAYDDGYKVYTTIRDRNQSAATRALHSTLNDYDRRHGFRGVEAHTDLADGGNDQDWIEILRSYSNLGELKPALVTSVSDKDAGIFVKDVGPAVIEWQHLEWARRYISENRRGPTPKTAEEILQRGDIIRVSPNAENQWQLMQAPEVEGALVSADPATGAVLALVGGYDFRRSQFNRIIQAHRQPGSSFKPFIYSAALEAGFTAASLVNDAPVIFDDPGIGGTWRPENYTGKYYGPTRLRDALIHSRNLVSIRVLNEIGVEPALEHIANFGYDMNELPHSLSLALGSGAVTPWQHLAGYIVLANGGYRVAPYFIDRIEQSGGKVVEKIIPPRICTEPPPAAPGEPLFSDATATGGTAPPNPSGGVAITPVMPSENPEPATCVERTLDPRNLWILTDMMRDVIQNTEGTGRRAMALGRKDLSGKTGTTNDQSDAWFAGFNARVVTIAWVGFDDFQRKLGNNETGGVAALPMWIEYMRTALEGVPESILERPAGLVNVLIDPISGSPTNAGDPRAIFEVFRVDNAPGVGQDGGLPEVFERQDTPRGAPEELF